MAATRVRVLFEFRNGDGNFLSMYNGGEFVACKGHKDIAALEAGFLLALQEHNIRQEEIQRFIESRRTPNHD